MGQLFVRGLLRIRPRYALANKKMRARIEELLKGAIAADETPADFKAAAQEWLEGKDDADASKAAAENSSR